MFSQRFLNGENGENGKSMHIPWAFKFSGPLSPNTSSLPPPYLDFTEVVTSCGQRSKLKSKVTFGSNSTLSYYCHFTMDAKMYSTEAIPLEFSFSALSLHGLNLNSFHEKFQWILILKKYNVEPQVIILHHETI